MRINKLKLQNFKKFHDSHIFEFNDDLNIIVGDNESGKSSLLEAIEICLNFTYRGKPLNAELSTELFNRYCVQAYLDGDKSQGSLPEIVIEAYLEGCPKFRGSNNSEREDTEGIFVRMYFDEDLSDSYSNFVQDLAKVSTLPVEFYKTEWYDFAWNRITHHNKAINCLFIDPSRLHPSYGRTKYINNIISAALDKKSRATLNLNFRQLKAKFDNEKEVVDINNNLDSDNTVTDKSLKITADISSNASWESNLQLAVDDILFNYVGKGEQNQIQIKLALLNKGGDVDVVMLEEPENHLSHINLVQLISHIEGKNDGKQIFLSTHSSYVLNKLSIDKLCLLAAGYTRLQNIEAKTVNMLKRLPGYDTLRVVLAQKVILVEGPSDELLIKKGYLKKHGRLPEADGIDVIVVRGIGFKTYLNIIVPLKHPIRVVKDNDADYQKNVIDWSAAYSECDFIQFFSPTNNEECSLEPSLVAANASSVTQLDILAKVMLSTQTYNEYEKKSDLDSKKNFLISWFVGESQAGKKVDSAIRIFDSEVEINFPPYLSEAIEFDA